MLIAQVNLWAVLAGTVSNMILGYLWYGPFFGKIWMAEMGSNRTSLTPAQKKEGSKAMAWAVLIALITSYVLADLMYYGGFLTPSKAIQFAVLVWLGFIATTQANNSIFEKRKWSLYIIGVSYQLVSLVVMATIIVLLK